MKKAMIRALFLFALFCGFAFPSFASDGFSSTTGPMPIGAGGNAFLWVRPNGSVLLGPTAFPAADIPDSEQAKLEVQGEIRIGVDPHFSGEGTACDIPGLLSYDGLTPGKLYLCSGVSWTKIPPE